MKWVYSALTLALLAVTAFLCILMAQRAGAGISAQGYADIAQKAVNKVGASFGYRATCKGVYDIPGPNFTIRCRVVEKP